MLKKREATELVVDLVGTAYSTGIMVEQGRIDTDVFREREEKRGRLRDKIIALLCGEQIEAIAVLHEMVDGLE